MIGDYVIMYVSDNTLFVSNINKMLDKFKKTWRTDVIVHRHHAVIFANKSSCTVIRSSPILPLSISILLYLQKSSE